MKILLVQSWLGRKGDLAIYPLGLAYLATVLEQRGHEIRVFDPNTADAPLEDTARVVKEYSPELVGLSFRNIDNQFRLKPFYYYHGMKKTLAVIRQACGTTPIVIGGAAFSILPDVFMERNPEIDLGLFLEGEESFPELVDNMGDPSRVKGIYYRNANGEVLFSGTRPLPDFKTVPYPRRHFLDLEKYKWGSIELVGVQTKRGCPLTYAYCVYPHLNGKIWRMRTPESVFEEIEYLHRDFGVKGITFADSVVNLPYDYSTRIFTLLKESKLDVNWLGYMHVRGVTKEYLQLCKDSGCTSVIFSPDGLSEGALNGLRKNIKPQEIRELKRLVDTDPAFRDLFVQWCFFVNPPGETLAGLLQTLWFFGSSKRFFRKRTRDTFINWIRMEPSSAVYQTALEEGVISPDTDLLPENVEQLAATFYSNPGTAWMDPMIMTLMRIPKIIRKYLGKLKR